MRRDLVREFVEACRKQDILPVLYHTTLDWVHPDFDRDFDAYLEYLRQSVEFCAPAMAKSAVCGLTATGPSAMPTGNWMSCTA